MLDMLKKNLLIGIGLASMTQAKINELGKKLAEESKLPQEEGEKFVEELMSQAEATKKSFEEQTAKIVEKAMSTLKLPCHDGIERIEAELKKIRKALEHLEAKERHPSK